MTTNSQPQPTALLDALRFAPERERVHQMDATFELEAILTHFEREGGVKSIRDGILSQQLKLTPRLAPRLAALLEQVREKLRYDAPVDLFVGEDAAINAFAVHSQDQAPHIISLTSRLIERMDDEEIRFVLGHELGHLCFQHYRMKLVPRAFGRDEDGDSNMPRLLARRLEIWQRWAELSADRAGFLAADGRLDVAVSVFFKLASGLGPEHLHFDIAAFLQQLEELRQLERRDSLSDFSHPAIPIRVRALQLYRDAGGLTTSAEQLAKVDGEVAELARLMEQQPSDPEELHKLNYVLAGGVLIGHSDGAGLGDRELQLLIEMLLPLAGDPEEAIASLTTVPQAEELLASSAAWLREHAGAEKFAGFRYLCLIAVAEGLTAGEQELLNRIADLTGIPRKAAGEILHEAMKTFAGKKSAATAPDLKLR
jgi:hypothetical protein